MDDANKAGLRAWFMSALRGQVLHVKQELGVRLDRHCATLVSEGCVFAEVACGNGSCVGWWSGDLILMPGIHGQCGAILEPVIHVPN